MGQTCGHRVNDPMTETHTYKQTPDCDIHLDIHRPDSEEQDRPAILWIHGGALINGSRNQRPKAFSRYTALGYVVFSIDYRLAPETKLPEIIEDVHDALQWIRTRGPEIARIDPTRVAAIGHSAGGYLTLQSGTFDQPPSALVSFYGYGDIIGPWYSEPAPFYCTKPMVEETAARQHHDGSPVTRSEDRPGSSQFYLYCRQQGIWPNEIGGRDPATDEAFFLPYCPERNVGPDYPPTLLLHGTDDTDVPYAQSVRMAESLDTAGIDHDLITIPGGGHGFEGGPGETDPVVIAAHGRVKDFLRIHLTG